MRVIGIDPGVAATGFAVLERDASTVRAVAVGVLRTAAGDAPGRRLAQLRDRLAEVLDEHRPDVCAIERVFFNANVRTAMSVGQASGMVLLGAAERGIEVFDYTPTEVKQAVTGTGSASKRQVQAMVASLLRLGRGPAPDAADACALAICHLNRSRFLGAVRAAEVGS